MRKRMALMVQEVNSMNQTNNTALILAFVVVVLLFLFLGGGMATGTMMSGGMMGRGMMGGVSWMWFPTLLTLGLGLLLGWVIFGKK